LNSSIYNIVNSRNSMTSECIPSTLNDALFKLCSPFCFSLSSITQNHIRSELVIWHCSEARTVTSMKSVLGLVRGRILLVETRTCWTQVCNAQRHSRLCTFKHPVLVFVVLNQCIKHLQTEVISHSNRNIRLTLTRC